MSSVVISKMLEEEELAKQLFVKFKKFLQDTEQNEEEPDLLQDKKQPKKGCSRGNHRHLPAGTKKGGQFGKKGMKKGSSSLANSPAYANMKSCRKGRARVVNGQERFISHSQDCGRVNPRNKCSEPKPRVTEVVVPDADGDGQVSVYQFARALDRKEREIKHLKRAVAKLKQSKCKSISAGQLAAMTREMALALKGKEPEPANP